MRQGDGAEILAANDPRSSEIGIIHVDPNDDRQSVLTAILTQDKAGKKQIVVDLPDGANKAFARPIDFEGLKQMRRGIQAQIVFITSPGSGPTEYARQRRFPVYSSFESYEESLNEHEDFSEEPLPEPEPEKKRGWFFGRKPAKDEEPVPPARVVQRGSTQPLPPSQVVAMAQSPVEEEAYEDEEPPLRRSRGARGSQELRQQRRNTMGPGGAAAAGAAGFAADEALRHRPASQPDPYGTDENAEDAEESFEDWGDELDETPIEEEGYLGPEENEHEVIAPPIVENRPGQSRASEVEQRDPVRTQRVTPSPVDDVADPGSTVINVRGRNGRPGRDAAIGDAGAAGALAASESEPNIIKITKSRPLAKPPRVTRGRGTVELNQPVARGARPVEEERTMMLPPDIAEEEEEDLQPRRTPNKNRSAAAMGAAGFVAGSASSPRTSNAAGGVVTPPKQKPVRPVGPPPVTPNPPPDNRDRRRSRAPLLLLLLLLLLLFACVAVAYAMPGRFGSLGRVLPGAGSNNSVSIVPANTHLSKDFVVTATKDPDPNPTARQVSSRVLTYTTPVQTKTAQASGKHVVEAKRASGTITFFNTNTTPTFVGVTTFPVGNSMSIVTDKGVSVPGGTLPDLGTVTVQAHASDPGPNGNINAGTISGNCCSAGIAAKNSDFTGGTEASNYKVVSQADIDGAADPLKKSEQEAAQKQLQAQLKPGEHAIDNGKCTPNVTSDHKADEKADAVTVSVTATCTQIVYNQEAAQNVTATLLKQGAANDPGAGYQLAGQVVTSQKSANVTDEKNGTVSLVLKAEGIWVYQFTDQTKQDLARQLAGKSKSAGLTILNNDKRIAKVKDVQLSGDNFPSDPKDIQFAAQDVPGLQPTATPPNGSGGVGGSSGSGTPVPGQG